MKGIIIASYSIGGFLTQLNRVVVISPIIINFTNRISQKVIKQYSILETQSSWD